ncbi:hypothetical protein DW241_10775 [Hungatella hathewayi]|nr:hypothetical protein DW241_10775 [Hungatella hathewayi]
MLSHRERTKWASPHLISPAPHSLRGLTTLRARCNLPQANNFLTHLCTTRGAFLFHREGHRTFL